jgi:hypothetical protein
MEEGQLIPIVSIVGGFSLGGLFWWLVIRAQVRAREMLHAERLAAIAKGLPPPDEPAAEIGGGAPNGSGALPQAPKADKALGTGLSWLFLGAGVILALRIVNPGSTSWGWGVIPVSLGLAYLAGVGLSYWQLAHPPKDDRPRQDDGHR